MNFGSRHVEVTRLHSRTTALGSCTQIILVATFVGYQKAVLVTLHDTLSTTALQVFWKEVDTLEAEGRTVKEWSGRPVQDLLTIAQDVRY